MNGEQFLEPLWGEVGNSTNDGAELVPLLIDGSHHGRELGFDVRRLGSKGDQLRSFLAVLFENGNPLV